MEQTYSSTQVAEAAGVSYRRLDYWVRTGLLAPSATETPPSGSGNPRTWTDGDLAAARVLAVLMELRGHQDADVTADRFRDIAAFAQRHGLRGGGRTRIVPGVWLDLDELAEIYDRSDAA